ncbi:hypothetical protein [Streptomyces sp. 147326]|uniref:hypothetical protein n=1 Tax=Streptomyces sp. 147326 TaxID=3074379 RepID=UPI003857BDAD
MSTGARYLGAAVSRTVIRRLRLGLVHLVAQSALLIGPTLIVLATGHRPPAIGHRPPAPGR